MIFKTLCAVMLALALSRGLYGPRHGAGFVWLAGYLLVPLYALFLARISIKERP